MLDRCVGSACGTSWNEQDGLWQYDSRYRICVGSGQGGGNNWAKGYFISGTELDLVEEAICREVEKCDRLATVWTLASASGGTGSGLGCALADCLDNVLGCSVHVMHGMILSGCQREDVAVGPFNATLAFANLLDANRRRTSVLMLNSDETRRSKVLGMKHDTDSRVHFAHKPTIDDINKELCASSLRPLVDVGFAALDYVASHPNFRLLSVTSTDVSCQEKRMCLFRQHHGLQICIPDFHKRRLTAAMRAKRANRAVFAIGGSFSSDMRMFCAVHPSLNVIRHSCEHLCVAPYSGKTQCTDVLSVVSNFDLRSDVAVLNDIVSKALAMATAKVFLHHFESHGVYVADIHYAIDVLRDVIGCYADRAL
mmetsp:Transcript_11030/g.33075  ORF Transcript_11030/g.33075 Transcript_11030/m.33075 type:complete len:368 (+) Transcript_11030:375-1478(+)